MRKAITLVVLFLVSVAIVFGLTVFLHGSLTQTEVPDLIKLQSATEPTIDDIVEDKLNTMSLDEKVAQLLIVQPNSTYLDDVLKQQLQTAPYGGIILMEPNYSTLAGTRLLVENIQNNAKTTMIISTDQEGGLVQRMSRITDRHATDFPDMYQVGQKNNEKLAEEIGRVLAEELRTVGVNVDFAPVIDVYSNPYNQVIGTRSFSSNPQTVAKLGLAVAHGLEQHGVVATYKHFPGHGDTATDSHLALPIIYKTYNQLKATELVPFQAAIQDGAQLIMVGHIALPQITGDNTPATLSAKIMTDILRKDLGYDGLIVTDGLNMGALTNNYPEAEIYYRAVEAGADLLVLPSNPTLAMQSIKTRVSEERINQSVRRILKFKLEKLQNYQYLDGRYFGSDEHARAVERAQ